MKRDVCERLRLGRVRHGEYATTNKDGLRGAFLVIGPLSRQLRILSSGKDTEYGWEHVSVSLENRCPTWIEMCHVKRMFWGDEEAVMQLHPPESDYVNCHPHTLHLWRPMDGNIPLPPSHLVGPKTETQQET